VRRDIAPSREARKVTPTISSSGTGVSRVGFNCEDEWFIETPAIDSYTPSSIGGYREGVGTLRANGGDIGGGSENLVATAIDQQTVGALCADSHPGAYSGQDAYTGRLIPQTVAVYENHPTDSRVKELGDVSSTVRARWGTGGGNLPMVSQPVGVDIFNAAFSGEVAVPLTNRSDGTGTGPTVMQPIGCFKGGQGSAAGGIGYDEHVSPTLSAADSGSNRTPTLLQAMAVRRLTPTECERLQGFPDGYTNIPWRKAAESPDGPRYKALGNSWAVPVVRWIGERIARAT